MYFAEYIDPLMTSLSYQSTKANKKLDELMIKQATCSDGDDEGLPEGDDDLCVPEGFNNIEDF